MAIKFKRGDSVTQVVTAPIIGTVTAANIVDDDVSFLVAYVGADGESHERFFKEDEIEVKGAQ